MCEGGKPDTGKLYSIAMNVCGSAYGNDIYMVDCVFAMAAD